MNSALPLLALVAACVLPWPPEANAQAHSGDSPFPPPRTNDTVFVSDVGSGLDTGCTYRGGGPLLIRVPVPLAYRERVAKLRQNGLIAETVRLQMPAFDVDYDGSGRTGVHPERDQVYFNGHLVPGQYLTGANETWVMNTYDIPVEWVIFPEDPGEGRSVSPADNIIEIHIDTANVDEEWCTAIDWVVLDLGPIARPTIFVHGILSSGRAWDKGGPGETSFLMRCEELGIPADNGLNMGNLDSIASNAGKVRDRVHSVIRRFGVGRVNLVCHSKGGLDSREYAELLGGDTVESLIQLGTPNAGSPLADAIQAGVFKGGGYLGGLLINSLISVFQGPAGIQLTTPYMGLYNAFHGHNPEVKYYAVAGDYRPGSGWFDDLLEKALLATTGPGDTIVPIDSVYALPFVTALSPVVTSGPNKEATHTSMNGSASFFSRILPQVSERSQIATTSLEDLFLKQGVTLLTTGGVFQTTGPVAVPVILDQARPVLFTTMYPTGQLSVSLVSPSGARWDSPGPVGETNILFRDGPFLDGRAAIAAIVTPETGTWLLSITQLDPAAITPDQGFMLLVTAAGEELTLQPLVEPQSVITGKVVRIEARLGDSARTLPGAMVQATVAKPLGERLQVPLTDDGTLGDRVANDGVYTAEFAGTTEAGIYGVTFAAHRPGSATEPELLREGFALFTVGVDQIGLSGQVVDAGEDTDGNGLFNWLRIGVGVSVTNAGTFLVKGELEDAQGHIHIASSRAPLPTGLGTLTLRFLGGDLFTNRVDGPYTLRRLTIASEEDVAVSTQVEATGLHTTIAYRHTQFEGQRLVLVGPPTAAGVDTDQDGLLDRLEVSLTVNSSVAGPYQGSCRLLDRNSSLITVANLSVTLAPGPTAIQCVFDGVAIGRHGEDGPYTVRDLLLFDNAGNTLIVTDVGTIEGFRASQFEGLHAGAVKIVTTSVPQLNRQTGLYEHFVTLTNESAAVIAAARIVINDLPSQVSVYNAFGTTPAGQPYIQLNQALSAGATVTLRLEYYSTDRVTVPAPALAVEPTAVAEVPKADGKLLAINRAERRPDGSILVEFRTIPRKTYVVEYSADLVQWSQAIPAVPAFGERCLWIDDGPPKTEPAPGGTTPRYYRVIELP